MKAAFVLPALALLCISPGFTSGPEDWLTENQNEYNVHYTPADKENRVEYNHLLVRGIQSVQAFTGSTFKIKFDVFIHPNRASLDGQWQKDWGMPDFKSECWMVASGMATKLDMISPKQWTKEACEHSYENKTRTEQLLTHELFHVYHGQLNVSPDFSNTEGIDWFVEGFATYASGQCDASRLQDVKKAIVENTVPVTLDKFWTGKLRYGLSGSVVKFMDEKYGRKKLLELLPLNKKSDVLAALNTTEENLLNTCRDYISGL